MMVNLWFRSETGILVELEGTRLTGVDPDNGAVFEAEFEDDTNIEDFLTEQGYEFIGEL